MSHMMTTCYVVVYVHVCIYVRRLTSLPLSYVRGEDVNDETGQLNVLAGMNMYAIVTCGLCYIR